MSREDLQKLLGGYATDTLSQAEQRALFEAALEDQDLFDALAREQALRDVLHQPVARQQLLAALGPSQVPARSGLWHWLQRPAVLAMAGGVATLVLVVGLVQWQMGNVAPPKYVGLQTHTPPKPFEPPPEPKRTPMMVLARPPVLNPQPNLANIELPAAAAAPKSYEVMGRLAKRLPPAELARQLYVTPPVTMGFTAGALPRVGARTGAVGGMPGAGHLGVRYGLLLRGADGEYAPARLDTELHTGDSFRLRLEPNDNGRLYLFERNSRDGWQLASVQHSVGGQPCLLPASGALQYDRPGPKELLVILSPRGQASFANLETTQLDALAASASADILKATLPSGESAYAVDTRAQAGQREVVFEITLQVH